MGVSVQSWIPDQDEDHPDSIFGFGGFIPCLSAIFKFYDTEEISHKIDVLSGSGLFGQPTTLCSVFQFIGNEKDG